MGETINKYGDIISGIFFFILALVYTNDIENIQLKAAATVDAAFIPKLLAAGMLVLSASIVINGALRLRRKDVQSSAGVADSGGVSMLPVLCTLLLLCLYVGLLETLGFSTCTVIYLFFQFLTLAPRRTGRDIACFAVLAVVLTFLLRWVFVDLLILMLPEGTLFSN